MTVSHSLFGHICKHFLMQMCVGSDNFLRVVRLEHCQYWIRPAEFSDHCLSQDCFSWDTSLGHPVVFRSFYDGIYVGSRSVF